MSAAAGPREAAVDLIKRYYEAFDRRDMPLFLALMGESVVHDINQGGPETGKDAFRRFMDKMNARYREKIVGLVVMANEEGTRAAAEFKVDGTYLTADAGLPPANGQKYLLAAGAFFEIQAGKVQRVTNYYNLPDWLAQVEK